MASEAARPRDQQLKTNVAPGFQTGEDGFLYGNGKRFIVKGVNWWGLEGPNRAPGGLMTRGMDELFDFLAEQGFNAMRTLVCHHGVLINGKLAAGSFDEGRNPTLVSKRYLEVLDIWVRSLSPASAVHAPRRP